MLTGFQPTTSKTYRSTPSREPPSAMQRGSWTTPRQPARLKKIVLSFGICNRIQKTKETGIKQLRSMIKLAKNNFPLSKIYIPQISFTKHLPAKEKLRLSHLNAYIAGLVTTGGPRRRGERLRGRGSTNWTPRTHEDSTRIEGLGAGSGDGQYIGHSGQHTLDTPDSEDCLQLEILEKGLTFIPTPKSPTRPELRGDLHTFHRRLKLIDHFWGAPRREPVPFTRPSTWEPRPLAHTQPNISQQDKHFLKTLGNSKHIVIKPADKGGQIVFQDRHNYILEAERQLKNHTYYVPLTHPLQLATQQLNQGHYTVYTATITSIPNKNNTWTARMNPGPASSTCSPRFISLLRPGRPLLLFRSAAPSSATAVLSPTISQNILITTLIPSKLHPSYLKDTYQFVNKINNVRVPGHSFLFSIDILTLHQYRNPVRPHCHSRHFQSTSQPGQTQRRTAETRQRNSTTFTHHPDSERLHFQ
ncbi:uncharacterized protein LOC119194644 isoform X2 [Pungitius pungitius]|uniref:uncharacterized protein LOC119194644 isoform X2 n=1 Tax=Pungitius pungitius TaxID=134920 RepID=UPI002E106D92